MESCVDTLQKRTTSKAGEVDQINSIDLAYPHCIQELIDSSFIEWPVVLKSKRSGQVVHDLDPAHSVLNVSQVFIQFRGFRREIVIPADPNIQCPGSPLIGERHRRECMTKHFWANGIDRENTNT